MTSEANLNWGGGTYRYIDKQKKNDKKRKDYGIVQLCPKSWGSKHSLALSPLNPPPPPPDPTPMIIQPKIAYRKV